MKQLNVLVTGSGSLYGVSILKALSKSDLQLHLVACDTNPRTLGLHIAHKGYIVPPSHQNADYLNKLIQIMHKEKIHAVFIASSSELEFFSCYKADIEQNTGAKVFANPLEVLQICMDKWHTVQFLQTSGFHYPLTVRYPEDQQQISSFINRVGFPIVVKPRRGSGSKGIFVVNNHSELNSAIQGTENLILQQFIPEEDGEFTTGICIGEKGRILSCVTLKRFLQDGITMAALSDDFSLVDDYCKQVASVLAPYGPCNFQLRMLDRKPILFEINPRFSSTTGMRASIGVNEAEILLRAEILRESVTEPTVLKTWIIRHYADQLVPLEQMNKIDPDDQFS